MTKRITLCIALSFLFIMGGHSQGINSLNLGDGINSNTKRIYPGALMFAVADIVPDETVSRTHYKLELFENSEQLFKSVNSSISTSFNIGMVGVEAAVNLINSKKINSYSVYLQVDVEVVKNRKYLQREAYNFDENILASLNEPSITWNNIFEQFGNKYVNSITYGGRFIAIYKFDFNSVEEISSLKTDLSVSGLATGSIDASLSDFSSKLSKYKSENIDIITVGFNDQIPRGIAEIIDYSLRFPDFMKKQPGAAIKYEFVDAYAMRNIPTIRRSTINNNNISTQAELMKKINNNLLIATLQKQNIEYYRSNKDFFVDSKIPDTDLTKINNTITSYADSLLIHLDQINNGQSVLKNIGSFPEKMKFAPIKYTQITNSDYDNGQPFSREILPSGGFSGPLEMPVTILNIGDRKRMLIHGYMYFNGVKQLVLDECVRDQTNKNHELYVEFYALNPDGTKTEVAVKSYFLLSDDNLVYDLKYNDYASLLNGRPLVVAIQYKLQSPSATRYSPDPSKVYIF